MRIPQRISRTARIALLPVLCSVIVYFLSFVMAQHLGADHARSATLAFTASGNNVELAIAVAISVFGITPGVAFATVIGPLVEVPVLICLVSLSLGLGRRWFRGDVGPRAARPERRNGASERRYRFRVDWPACQQSSTRSA